MVVVVVVAAAAAVVVVVVVVLLLLLEAALLLVVVAVALLWLLLVVLLRRLLLLLLLRRAVASCSNARVRLRWRIGGRRDQHLPLRRPQSQGRRQQPLLSRKDRSSGCCRLQTKRTDRYENTAIGTVLCAWLRVVRSDEEGNDVFFRDRRLPAGNRKPSTAMQATPRRLRKRGKKPPPPLRPVGGGGGGGGGPRNSPQRAAASPVASTAGTSPWSPETEGDTPYGVGLAPTPSLLGSMDGMLHVVDGGGGNGGGGGGPAVQWHDSHNQRHGRQPRQLTIDCSGTVVPCGPSVAGGAGVDASAGAACGSSAAGGGGDGGAAAAAGGAADRYASPPLVPLPLLSPRRRDHRKHMLMFANDCGSPSHKHLSLQKVPRCRVALRNRSASRRAMR
jgi:hypothetical protein